MGAHHPYAPPNLVTVDYGDRASVSWNWIEDMIATGGVEPAVGALLGKAPPPRIADPAVWQRDVSILRALLELADTLPQPRTTESLIKLISTRDRLEDHLTKSGRSSPRLDNLLEFDDPRDFSLRTEFILTALEGVRSTTRSDLPNFSLRQLFARPTFMCVTSPVADEPRSISFAALVLSLALSIGFGRFGTNSGLPVLLAIDEAARMTGRINLEEVMSMGASAGLRTLLALQFVEQLQQSGLSESSARGLLSNADTMIVLAGSSPGTVRAFADRLGQTDVPFQQSSVNYANHFNPSRTLETRNERRAVLGDREIGEIPFGDRSALVHCRASVAAPFVVDLTREDLRPTSI
jgi:hypothetical protein